MGSVEVVELLPGVENDRIFNVAFEIQRAQAVLREHVTPHPVLHWIRQQTESFLAEFGVGESLAIQPPYLVEVRTSEETPEVFVYNNSEYGEQSGSYLAFEGAPQPIREGLVEAYRLLSKAAVGEGVLIVSPTDFYEDYGSTYDVANIFRVIETREDGTRLAEGRYFLLRGKLTSYERAFLLNFHNSEAHIPIDATPSEIVRSPQTVVFPQRILDSQDPLVTHAERVVSAFRRQFGKELLGGETDLRLYRSIRALVEQHLPSLYQSLVGKDREAFLRRLREMIFGSQREWARVRGIPEDEHLSDIFLGRIPLGGIHPITGSPVGENGEAMGDGVSGCEETAKKYCPTHGEYEGEDCPKCP